MWLFYLESGASLVNILIFEKGCPWDIRSSTFSFESIYESWAWPCDLNIANPGLCPTGRRDPKWENLSYLSYARVKSNEFTEMLGFYQFFYKHTNSGRKGTNNLLEFNLAPKNHLLSLFFFIMAYEWANLKKLYILYKSPRMRNFQISENVE